MRVKMYLEPETLRILKAASKKARMSQSAIVETIILHAYLRWRLNGKQVLKTPVSQKGGKRGTVR